MKSFLLAAAFAFLATPCFAALKVGDTAPDFTAAASLGGKEFQFHLYDALKRGPAVVYFYPSAYTQGCDLEAHTFAENKDRFTAAGASIIGVSGDNLERLNRFAADPNFCAGKFPIAADESLNIAKSYHLVTAGSLKGIKDVNGADVSHVLIERMTFVVDQDRKVVAVLSSRADVSQKINQLIEKTAPSQKGPTFEEGLTPDQHVFKSLEIVRHAGGKTG
ncbi:MAG TPA: redoxin domain-containing protein [Rhizomicrobium sp.]|nr:redoxin domain-containing protein [Rhizomicrobium sp.]